MADRISIARLIIDLLHRKLPLRARNIAATIRDEVPDLSLQDVNSVLYRELAGDVVQNGSYEWTIKQPGPGTLQYLTKTAEELDQRASFLRAVQRLRAGLPPQEHIGELTVGNSKSTIAEFINSTPGSKRWMLITGDYGNGKSHTLSLLENEARRSNYATCHLSADGATSALNHPQRFLPLLLNTLELPSRLVNGYQDFLHEFLESGDHAINTVAAFVAQRLSDSTTLRRDVDLSLQALRNAAAEERLTRKQVLISLLAGDSISARPGNPGVRSQAYDLLGIAQDTVMVAGARGLTLIIDEAESIYTKLPSTPARYGAFKVLSALAKSPRLSDCRVAIGVTPDALRQLEAIDFTTAYFERLPIEPVDSWARDLRDRRVPIIHCRPLSIGDKRTLLTNVANLYTTAFPNLRLQGGIGTAWQDFRTATAAAALPTRIAIRRAVDYLDIERCALHAHSNR